MVVTVRLVEQNAVLALDVADHGYVMENGCIVLEGPATTLRQNSDIKEFISRPQRADHAAHIATGNATAVASVG
jgi:hypothetical protein